MFEPSEYNEKICPTHKIKMVVKPNGFARGKQQYRQFCKVCKAEKYSEWIAQEGVAADRSRNFRTKYPDKYLANKAINNAVKAKRAERLPCKVCGQKENTQAHHEDYKKPLDVIWLCTPCHSELHRIRRRMAA